MIEDTLKPISAIIPTANRAPVLSATFISLSKQSIQPEEIIVIDASDDDSTALICSKGFDSLYSKIIYIKAIEKGAATQRNQGIGLAKNEFIFFCDDDILFEPLCLELMWTAINSDSRAGGVNAMVTNQRYLTPGKATRIMYNIMAGNKLDTYAGKCIGPAWNLLPEEDESLPQIVPVEWLNTTCTLYRKEALPNPVFPSHFKGYSMMEDLTLSSIVGKNWKLLNARTARMFHDSQPGTHKSSAFVLAKMELVNRQYVMSQVLGRNSFTDYSKMILLESFFTIANIFSANGIKKLPAVIAGKFAAIGTILAKKLSGNSDV